MARRRSRLAALLALVALGGCAVPGVPRAVPVATPVSLAAGAAVTLPDRSTLTYRGLANDSRCPRGVQCIHAGSVEVRFEHATGAATVPVVIVAPRQTAAAVGDRWRATLVDPDGATPGVVAVRIDPVR